MPYRLKQNTFVEWWLSTLALLSGLVLVVFDERFSSSRSWRFAAGIPGGYAMWGGILTVLGAFMLAVMCRRRTIDTRLRRDGAFVVGLFAVGLWWVILGALFFYTSIVDPLAVPLGAVVWTAIGVLYWSWGLYERNRFR